MEAETQQVLRCLPSKQVPLDTKAPVFIHLSFIGTLEEKQTRVRPTA